ncbi:TPA: hypothetical protein ACHS94_000678 [Citrobacter freundii]|uniref:hypothetical protein n=1 Tax=Citrobacter freundii TaxID=546 RepID=UPI00376CB855
MTTITKERLQEVIDGDIAFTDEQREMARIALASLDAEPVPCPKCNGTEMTDSGGVQPWGEPILIECDCRSATLQSGNSPVAPDCWCRTCRPVTMSDMRFVVCPDCGNKRCPHANDHRNACTGSNELGQIGSAYPAAPQQEVKP